MNDSVLITRVELLEAYQKSMTEFFELYCKFPDRKRPRFADILEKHVFDRGSND